MKSNTNIEELGEEEENTQENYTKILPSATLIELLNRFISIQTISSGKKQT